MSEKAKDVGGSTKYQYEEVPQKRRFIIRASELQRTETKHGFITPVINEKTFPDAVIAEFIGEIPPNSKTGTHRHSPEACIHILEGAGYSIVGEEKVEWSQGDTLFIPTMTWHQHINTGNKRVRFLAATSRPLARHLGLDILEQKTEKEFSSL